MKTAPKLLIVLAIFVMVAGLCGGWKWGATPNRTTLAVAYVSDNAKS